MWQDTVKRLLEFVGRVFLFANVREIKKDKEIIKIESIQTKFEKQLNGPCPKCGCIEQRKEHEGGWDGSTYTECDKCGKTWWIEEDIVDYLLRIGEGQPIKSGRYNW